MLAVVTCLFSPADFQRPLQNYHRFAEGVRAQGVPLFTAELAFGQKPFLLTPSPHLHQTRSHSILWAKESLLNTLIKRLPPEVDKVVWADADVLWEDGAFDIIERALDEDEVLQAFDTAYRLFPEQTSFSTTNPWGQPLWPEAAVAGRMSREESVKDACWGFAWAARRSFFEAGGLYERGILGGGDTLLVNALASFDQPAYLPAVFDDIQAWSERLKALSLRPVSARTRLAHLWHGDLKLRRYEDRHEILVKHGFDPLADIRKTGWAYEWVSAKPGLHSDVAAYFLGRKEDEIPASGC